MRHDVRDKNISFKEFKKMFGSYYAHIHESVREKALIKAFEETTGQKHVTKGSPKKDSRARKGNAKADSASIGEHEGTGS